HRRDVPRAPPYAGSERCSRWGGRPSRGEPPVHRATLPTAPRTRGARPAPRALGARRGQDRRVPRRPLVGAGCGASQPRRSCALRLHNRPTSLQTTGEVAHAGTRIPLVVTGPEIGLACPIAA